MGSHAWNVQSVLFAGAMIAASPGISVAQTRNFSYSDKSSTMPLLGVATRNAPSLPAQAKRAGDTFLVVTYQGSPQDFVICTRGTAEVTGELLLDLRSTLEVQGSKLSTTTLYIVTDVKNPNVSLAFNGVEVAKSGGLSCRATGAMERKLLGAQ